MSHLTKLPLWLLLILMVVLPILAQPTLAQKTSEIAITVDPHEANIWNSKVEFWRDWKAQQRLQEHIAKTWEAKTEYFRELEINDHIAKTWKAKTEFWQNIERGH